MTTHAMAKYRHTCEILFVPFSLSGENKCQCSRWAGQRFPKLAGSRIGCVYACCSVGHTLDLWRLGRSQPLQRRVEVSRERTTNRELYLCQNPSHRPRLQCLHRVEKYQRRGWRFLPWRQGQESFPSERWMMVCPKHRISTMEPSAPVIFRAS
jgi:hypothetical protein